MKLIVQIPCLNEAETLPATLAGIPRRIDGIDAVEILVVDDGSTDDTSAVARTLGVDHFVRQTHRRGLAAAFRAGLDAALKAGADIIVNIDGDNEHSGADIPLLVRPILEGRADIVVGDRQTRNLAHFSPSKRFLQGFGSRVVRWLSGVDVPDAVCGFRAISREAAIRLNIVSSFSYTIEMLIQAGRKQLAVAAVPIATNKPERPSRLAKSIPHFIQRSLVTMLRIYAMYQPLKVFAVLGFVLAAIGMLPILRFIYFAFTGGSGHVQSLILGGVLVLIAVFCFLIGLIADLIGFNRQLLETTLEKMRELELTVARIEAGEGAPPAAEPPREPVALDAARRRAKRT